MIMAVFMNRFRALFCFIFLFLFSLLYCSPLEQIPVSYKGRFRPAEAYTRLWLYDLYQAEVLKRQDWKDFNSKTGSALDLLWQFHIKGYQAFVHSPLFWIRSAETKNQLGLNPLHQRFSYQELQQALYVNPESSRHILEQFLSYYFLKAYFDQTNRSRSTQLELTLFRPGLWVQLQHKSLNILALPTHFAWPFVKVGDQFPFPYSEINEHDLYQNKKMIEELSNLILALHQFEELTGTHLVQEENFQLAFQQLKAQSSSPKEIQQTLERNYPLIQRLKAAGHLWKILPGRYEGGEWFSPHAFKVLIYNPKDNRLQPISNFTLFSDREFETLKKSYLAWETAVINGIENQKILDLHQQFLTYLDQAYQTLEGQIYQQAQDKALTYPSKNQLKWETFYYQYPLIGTLIVLYSLAILILIFDYQAPTILLHRLALIVLGIAFAFHTFILLLRCYILGRPPVSNMFETVIYVPWITVLVSFIFRFFLKHPLILIASAFASIILLVLIQITDLNHSLDNLQAVLDSQFWLMIHVLMIVGSYGIFILGGILGHFYLGLFAYYQKQTPTMRLLAQCILQTMYMGVAFLIPGTILGGIWAAESWGRFWDWDPKESWAFISSCIYLIWIHAYYFHQIADFGLAMGSIIGLLAISFTWYGVNYILGTGLHSYGFGSGGEYYYYVFLLLELLILIGIGCLFNRSKNRNLAN